MLNGPDAFGSTPGGVEVSVVSGSVCVSVVLRPRPSICGCSDSPWSVSDCRSSDGVVFTASVPTVLWDLDSLSVSVRVSMFNPLSEATRPVTLPSESPWRSVTSRSGPICTLALANSSPVVAWPVTSSSTSGPRSPALLASRWLNSSSDASSRTRSISGLAMMSPAIRLHRPGIPRAVFTIKSSSVHQGFSLS